MLDNENVSNLIKGPYGIEIDNPDAEKVVVGILVSMSVALIWNLIKNGKSFSESIYGKKTEPNILHK
ncbi:TPA: hypothetical protein R4331_002121 [Pasteurella multocida]|nr:hypothetical protein [Pasteurella multocida]